MLKRSLVLVLIVLSAHDALAQLAEPNAAGVSMGHLHFFVDDIAANRDFWVTLGGTAAPFADGEIVTLPGVLVLISQRDSQRGPSLIDHVAFRVRSLDAIASRGLEVRMLEGFPGIASVYAPNGDRIELFEEGTATNIGFDFDPSVGQPGTNRHNEPLAGTFDSHHLHFYLPEDQVPAAREWYVRHFGAVPGMRWRYDAADLPGMNLNFSAADAQRPPSAGRSLDHIGFEVMNLEAFCRTLEAAGIELDRPFERISPDLAVAVLTDPWGTTVELTEGLAGR